MLIFIVVFRQRVFVVIVSAVFFAVVVINAVLSVATFGGKL